MSVIPPVMLDTQSLAELPVEIAACCLRHDPAPDNASFRHIPVSLGQLFPCDDPHIVVRHFDLEAGNEHCRDNDRLRQRGGFGAFIGLSHSASPDAFNRLNSATAKVAATVNRVAKFVIFHGSAFAVAA